MSQEKEPIVMDMYAEVGRLKQVFRHFEGIPIPLPVPATITGIASAIIWEIVAFKWIPWGDPFTKYLIIPIILATLISYLEPEQVSPIAWVYAYIRKGIRPTRRVVNRPIPRVGHIKEYKQYTIIRKSKEGRF